MFQYITLLLDRIVHQLEEDLRSLELVVTELQLLQLKFPELADSFDDEIREFLGRMNRIDALRSDVIDLKKKYSDRSGIFFLNEQQKEIKEMFLKVNQKAKVSLAIKDKFGNPATVDGKPTWALTDESLGELAVSEDGMSAEFSPKGPIGTLKCQVKADADLGEGVKEIIGELDLELAAGDAEILELSAEIA